MPYLELKVTGKGVTIFRLMKDDDNLVFYMSLKVIHLISEYFKLQILF